MNNQKNEYTRPLHRIYLKSKQHKLHTDNLHKAESVYLHVVKTRPADKTLIEQTRLHLLECLKLKNRSN